ncbi:MAG TPA: hypothetical protein VMB21_03240 [Candidatus Limnocylindria bacterium]|nr:hypothetical protein [Candidatus Limnocylindria bacterium]
MPTKEGYQYQLETSTNLKDWTVSGQRRIATGPSESFTYALTNPPAAYFRASEFAPDLTRLIPGLKEIYFDNATLDAAGGTLVAKGIRLVSRDFTTDDLVRAVYTFDPLTQNLKPSQIVVLTNVGPTCGKIPEFFLKDVPSRISMKSGGQTYPDRTLYTLSASKQDLAVSLVTGQVLALVVQPVPENITFELFDSSGTLLVSNTLLPDGVTRFLGPYNVYRSDELKFRFSPQSGSAQIQFAFANCNAYALKSFANGQRFTSSIGYFWYDYDKFKVQLAAGQTLQMDSPGDAGSYLEIHNSRGVSLFRSKSSGGVIRFTASAADTYYVIYSHDDFTGHAYSSIISITP